MSHRSLHFYATEKSTLTGTQLRTGRCFSQERLKTLKQDCPSSFCLGPKTESACLVVVFGDLVALRPKNRGPVSEARKPSAAALKLGAQLFGRVNTAIRPHSAGLLPSLSKLSCLPLVSDGHTRPLERT